MLCKPDNIQWHFCSLMDAQCTHTAAVKLNVQDKGSMRYLFLVYSIRFYTHSGWHIALQLPARCTAAMKLKASYLPDITGPLSSGSPTWNVWWQNAQSCGHKSAIIIRLYSLSALWETYRSTDTRGPSSSGEVNCMPFSVHNTHKWPSTHNQLLTRTHNIWWHQCHNFLQKFWQLPYSVKLISFVYE